MRDHNRVGRVARHKYCAVDFADSKVGMHVINDITPFAHMLGGHMKLAVSYGFAFGFTSAPTVAGHGQIDIVTRVGHSLSFHVVKERPRGGHRVFSPDARIIAYRLL